MDGFMRGFRSHGALRTPSKKKLTQRQLEDLVSRTVEFPFSILVAEKGGKWNRFIEQGFDTVMLEVFKRGLMDILKYICEKLPTHVEVNKIYHYCLKDEPFDPMMISLIRYLGAGDSTSLPNEFVYCMTTGTGVEVYDDAPLHIAARCEQIELIEFLIERKADIHGLNCCGRTPLLAGVSHKSIIDFFVKAGANINLQDNRGFTPLMLAVIEKNVDNVKALMDFGADPTLVDKHGYTALHHALNKDSKECFETLLGYSNVSLRCNSLGQILYADRQLFVALPPEKPSQILLFLCNSLSLPSDVVLSATALMEVKDIVKKIKDPVNVHDIEYLVQLREDYNAQHDVLPSVSCYGDRREVNSKEELDALLAPLTPDKKEKELKYQVLLMAERLGGQGSYLVCRKIILTAEHFMRNEGYIDECFKLLLRVSEMLLNVAKAGILFTYEIGTIFESIGTIVMNLDPVNLIPVELLYSVMSTTVEAIIVQLNCIQSCHGHSEEDNKSLAISPIMNVVTPTMALLTRFLHMCTNLSHTPEYAHFEEIAQTICKRCPILNFSTYTPPTLLHNSLFNYGSEEDYIKTILKWGIHRFVNIRSLMGNAPLHMAVIQKETTAETINSLLDHGAHIDISNCDKMSPLDLSYDEIQTAALKKHYPLRLACLAANTVVRRRVQYWSLPLHMQEFIKFHVAPKHAISIL